MLSAVGWRWVIVGGGTVQNAPSSRRCGQHGIAGHVIFAGRVPDRDLHAWYEAASVFVHPTRYEGSSLVTLEAMAHRRAVIATGPADCPTRCAGRQRLARRAGRPGRAGRRHHGRGGATPPRLLQMGAESRRIVEQQFAWTGLAERHIEMYEELLAQRRGVRLELRRRILAFLHPALADVNSRPDPTL